MNKTGSMLLFWIAAAACCACSPGDDGGGGNGDRGDVRDDGGASGEDGRPSDDDGVGTDVPDVPTEVPICDEVDFRIERIIPDMLVILDRSNSMSDGGFWTPVRDAIIGITSDFESEIYFGLMTFPNAIPPRSCLGLNYQCEPASGVLVPVGPDNALRIQTELASLVTCGGTPTAMTLQAAQIYMATLTTGHPQYLLLATDGAPNCNGGALDGRTCRCTGINCALNSDNCLDDARTYAMVDALRGAGITTFVLGIATTAFWDVMDEMARRGGTETAFRAERADEIRTRFREIAGAVASCDFDIGELDPDADREQVNFYFDGLVVPMDPDGPCDAGWRWVDAERTRVEFCGEYCDRIMTSGVRNIGAKFGCPTVLI